MNRKSKQRRYWLAGDREPGQDEFFVEALDPKIWRRGDARHWDSCWYTGMPDARTFERLQAGQSVNHIPGNNGLTVKSYLYQTLRAARERLHGLPQGTRMDYFPRNFLMPGDYRALQLAALAEPDKIWIKKPVNSSRGRGVGLLPDAAAAPRDPEWLVQEYLANPHLMNRRKYVLRLYVLVTSALPLRAYFYHEGFAKLASEPFDLDDLGNVYSHLTNPDINAENDQVEQPVVFVGLARYREWLRAEGHDDSALFAKIRDMLMLSVVAVREQMRRRHVGSGDCYELLGVDCMIDNDLKPWILECNLSPSLEVCAAPEDGGDFERATKRQLVRDMVALLGLNDQAPASAPDAEAKIRHDADREAANKGGFTRLCPSDDASDYLGCFPVPRYADLVLTRHVTGQDIPAIQLAPARAGEWIGDDELALYAEVGQQLYFPNDVAAWVWLKLAEGEPVNAIVDEAVAQRGDDWQSRVELWDLLADWAQQGLVFLAGAVPAVTPRAETPVLAGEDWLGLGDRRFLIEYGCPAAQARLRPLLAPLAAAPGDGATAIRLLTTPSGYAIAAGARLLASDVGLGEAAASLWQILFESAAGPGQLALKGGLVAVNDQEAVFLVSDAGGGFDQVALALGGRLGCGGAAVLDLASGRMTGLGLPCRTGFGMAPARAIAGQFPVKAVIRPQQNDSGEVVWNPIGVPAMLAAVLPGCAGRKGSRLDAKTVEALAEWLAGVENWRLDFTDPGVAAARIGERFGAAVSLRTA